MKIRTKDLKERMSLCRLRIKMKFEEWDEKFRISNMIILVIMWVIIMMLLIKLVYFGG